MSTLEWSRIDNEKTFQRLVNHLFALECNSPGFIPSSPYIGADGGFDGDFTGEYPMEELSGHWSIQSKWTTKSMKEAQRILTKEIKAELDKAKQNKADHLRVATNAQMKTSQVRTLEKLNTGTSISLKVWHRERLTIRIERQPFLRHFFFGAPQFPKFVPWNLYFNENAPQLLPIDGVNSSFEQYLARAKRFLLSDRTVLLVHSPGGYGKSHLLRQIASLAHQTNNLFQPWATRLGPRSMTEAIGDELVPGRAYVLFLDEADAITDDLRSLLTMCKTNPRSTKLVIALRSAALQAVNEQLNALRLAEFSEDIRIEDWSSEDLVKLLHVAAGKDTVPDELEIVAQYPNPFIIVWIGRRLSGQTTFDIEAIKARLSGELEFEAFQCLNGLMPRNVVTQLVTNLTLISPISKRETTSISQTFIALSPPTISSISTVISQERELLQDSLNRMIRAGILREIGDTVRFNPDMKGDLYLLRQIQNMNVENLISLVDPWLQTAPENALNNLASAAKYAEVPSLRRVLAGHVLHWSLHPNEGPHRSMRGVLNAIPSITPIVPTECARLLRCYIERDDDDPRLPLSTDDYGPVIAQLISTRQSRSTILDIINLLHRKNIPGRYDNYKTKSLIRSCVSPLQNSASQICEALSILETWINGSDTQVELLFPALSEVLAGSHEYSESRTLRVTFGEKILSQTAEVTAIRDEALRVLSLMIEHSSPKARIAALDVAEVLGKTRLQRVSESALPLESRIAQERRHVTRLIGNTIRSDMDFAVLNKIENLFLTWWAQSTPGTEETEKFLEAMPRSSEYLMFSHYLSPYYISESFENLRKNAPQDGRWKWFIQSFTSRRVFLPEEFDKITSTLPEKYPTPGDVLRFLKSLDKSLREPPNRVTAPILTSWVHQQRPVFAEIRSNNALWADTPTRFKDEMQAALAELDGRFLRMMAEETISELPRTSESKVQAFLACTCRFQFTRSRTYSRFIELLDKGGYQTIVAAVFDKFSRIDDNRTKSTTKNTISSFSLYLWLHKLLTFGSSGTKYQVISYLDFLFDKFQSVYLLTKLLRLGVSMEDDYQQLSFAVSLVLLRKGNIIGALPSHELVLLRRALLNRLVEMPNLDYDSQRIISFVCSDIQSVIFLLQERLSTIRMKDYQYEPIPGDGIDAVASLTKSVEAFDKLMDAVIAWYSKDAIYQMCLRNLFLPFADPNRLQMQASLTTYIDRQLNAHRIENALTACEFLELKEDNSNIFARVGSEGISAGLRNQVESMFYRKTHPPHAYTARPGEPPPELVRRKAIFQKIKDDQVSSETVRVIADSCIHDIDEMIKLELSDDEKFSTPRG